MNNKNNILFAIIFFTIISMIDGALPENNRHVDDELDPVTLTRSSSRVHSDDTYFNGNEWHSAVVNDGQWASYQGTYDGSGGVWPRGSNKSVIYNAGLWIGFIDDDGSYRMAGAEYGSDFRPGPYGNLDWESNNDYRVYKVNRWDDATDTDWAEWPTDLGAPWEDNNSDGNYNPAVDHPYLPLDQTLFTVYSDSGDHDQFGGSPIGAEIRQTIFGGASSAHDDLARTFYVKYEIINRDTFNWNNPLFGVWSDTDLGDASDDLVGIDVDSNLVFTYNSNDQDDVFPIPPAVGFRYISGLNSLNGDLYAAGAIGNLSDIGDYNSPNDQEQAYNRMLGLQNNGNSITDPNTGQDTTFMMNGDPVSGTGWTDENAGDRGMFMSVSANLSSGETTAVVAPGDTVGFVMAVIIAQGTDRLNSITELRDASYEAKSLWDNNFADVTFVDRPIIESDEDNDLFSNILLDNVSSGGTTEIIRTYHNTGNEALNVSMSINNNNYSITPSSATISAGGSQSFTFSYTADNFTYSAHNVPSEYGTIQGAVDATMVTTFSDIIDITIDDPYVTIEEITIYYSYDSADTVYVSPGTYTENVVLERSTIMIATDDDPVSTIIDGSNNGSVITVDIIGPGMFILDGFTIQNGQSNYVGGGILFEYDFVGVVNIKNNIIKDNYADQLGGGLYSWQATGSVSRNIFINNSTNGGGNAVRLNVGGINFYNNTLWENENGSSRRSLYVRSSDHRIINNIIWDNDSNDFDYIEVNESPTIEYNIVKNGYDGTGNISDDPGLIDPDNGDFRPSPSSVAIDAGDPDLDQDGLTWESDPDDQDPDGSRLDIGAFYIDPFNIWIDELDIIHGDTALVAINVASANNETLSAIEISFVGYAGLLEFIELVADSGLVNQLGWTTALNETDSLLITASAGATDITGSGVLFWLKFYVPDTLESQFVPINVNHLIFNTDIVTSDNYYNGGIQVVWRPDVGFTVDQSSGSYPLNVTFTDTSVVGTYTLAEWLWDFGNDSTATGPDVSTTYEYPGIYDVGLIVKDDHDFSDTLIVSGLIQVDTTYGDVDWNTMVQAFDASLILKDLVEMIELDTLQRIVGDVSGNDSLSTLDASLILQYVVGLITELPYDPGTQFLAMGDLSMEDQGAAPGSVAAIPVSISNGSNIYGFEAVLEFDPAVLEYDTLLLSETMANYLIIINPLEEGVVKVAASGSNVDGNEGVFATLYFNVSNEFTDETVIQVNNLRWNEGEIMEDAAEMTLSFALGIGEELLPDVYALHQNYPNPFNPITTLRYDLPKNSLVNITIYDMLGRQVKSLINQTQDAGFKSVIWDATNDYGKPVSAGVYLYQIQAGEFVQTKKMVLLK